MCTSKCYLTGTLQSLFRFSFLAEARIISPWQLEIVLFHFILWCLTLNNICNEYSYDHFVFTVAQWTWMKFPQSAASVSPVVSAWRMSWEVLALVQMRASPLWPLAHAVRARLCHSSQFLHHRLGLTGEYAFNMTALWLTQNRILCITVIVSQFVKDDDVVSFQMKYFLALYFEMK